MSTIDRLRELMRNNRAAPTLAEPPVSTRAADHANQANQAPLRELTYEPVDEAGQPMPSREDVPALPGASLLDTPLGRCIHVDYVFEADRLYGQVRVEDGCVSPADVIGFCEAQTLARDAGGSAPAGNGGCRGGADAGASGGYWAGGSLSLQQDLGVLEADGPVMFLDLETTGLSGGAGTVAFLVGVGFSRTARSGRVSSCCQDSRRSARCCTRSPSVWARPAVWSRTTARRSICR